MASSAWLLASHAQDRLAGIAWVASIAVEVENAHHRAIDVRLAIKHHGVPEQAGRSN